MLIFIFLALLIAIVAVIFALQNLAAVTVTFFFWNIQGSLALVLLVTLASGVLISLLASMPGLIRNKWSVSSQKRKLAALNADRGAYQQKAESAEKQVKDLQLQVHDLEEQLASLSAELDKYLPKEESNPS